MTTDLRAEPRVRFRCALTDRLGTSRSEADHAHRKTLMELRNNSTAVSLVKIRLIELPHRFHRISRNHYTSFKYFGSMSPKHEQQLDREGQRTIYNSLSSSRKARDRSHGDPAPPGVTYVAVWARKLRPWNL